MEAIDNTIIPLAEAAGIMVGETINTLMFNETAGVSMRTITDVYVKRENGKQWLMVNWTPSGQTAWGTADCGFAGWLVDDDLKDKLRAKNTNAAKNHNAE